MSHRNLWIAACVVSITLSGQFAQAQGTKAGRKPGQPADSAAKGQLPSDVLKRFDANGNGKLDPEEQKAAMQAREQLQSGKGKPGKPGTGRPPNGPPGTQPGSGAPGAGMPGGNMANLPPQVQQQLLQRFDANGNGQLDPNEQQAAQQFMQQMQGGRGPGGPGGAGGGFGGPGGAMNPQMMQQLLQRFDANGNGQLDPNEQQAAQQYMQQMQGGRGPGGPGGAGGGFGGGAGGPGGGAMNPQMMQQLLQRFDANGNGQLDPDEQQAARQAMQQMQGGNRPNKN